MKMALYIFGFLGLIAALLVLSALSGGFSGVIGWTVSIAASSLYWVLVKWIYNHPEKTCSTSQLRQPAQHSNPE
jgi:hypothetical protein